MTIIGASIDLERFFISGVVCLFVCLFENAKAQRMVIAYCFKTQENQRFSAKKMKGYEIKFQDLRKLQYQRDKINYALYNFIVDKIFAPYNNIEYSNPLRLSVYQHILS